MEKLQLIALVQAYTGIGMFFAFANPLLGALAG